MNKINPLYILTSIIIILLFVLFILGEKNTKLYKANNDLNKIIRISNDYKNIKNVWLNKTFVNEKLEKIIKSFNTKVIKTLEKDVITVHVDSLNDASSSKFLNKILNENFLIDELLLKKNSILIKIRVK